MVEVVDNNLGGVEKVGCKLWLLVSWLSGIKFKFLSGLVLLFKGDKRFVEPEVKTVERLLLVYRELLEVTGWGATCLVGSETTLEIFGFNAFSSLLFSFLSFEF